MADDVTLEDLQKVYKRFEALEAVVKETARLLKANDEFASDINKNAGSDAKEFRDALKKIDARLTALEKAKPKK